jgi:hypothetical protein
VAQKMTRWGARTRSTRRFMLKIGQYESKRNKSIRFDRAPEAYIAIHFSRETILLIKPKAPAAGTGMTLSEYEFLTFLP